MWKEGQANLQSNSSAIRNYTVKFDVKCKLMVLYISTKFWFCFVDIVRAVFETHGFQDMGKKDFSPHLTIAKMSRNQRGRGRGGGRGRRRGRRQEGAFKGICEDLYAEFKDREFGVERVCNVAII